MFGGDAVSMLLYGGWQLRLRLNSDSHLFGIVVLVWSSLQSTILGQCKPKQHNLALKHVEPNPLHMKDSTKWKQFFHKAITFSNSLDPFVKLYTSPKNVQFNAPGKCRNMPAEHLMRVFTNRLSSITPRSTKRRQ